MKKDAYRDWLIVNENSPNTVNTRTATNLKLERSLKELGLPDATLENCWERDKFESLNKRLNELLEDVRRGGDGYKILSPGAAAPDKAIYSHRTHLKNYSLFLMDEERGLKRSDWFALERLRNRFLEVANDFESFLQTSGEYFEQEREYKDAFHSAVQGIIATYRNEPENLGRQIHQLLEKGSGAPLRWQTRDTIEKAPEALKKGFLEAIANLALVSSPSQDDIFQCVETLWGLRGRGLEVLKTGEVWGTALTVAGILWPELSAPFKIMKARDASKALIDDPIFGYGQPTKEELDKWLTLLRRIFSVMRDVWQWQPKDLLDVQGFLWMALDKDYAALADQGEVLEDIEGLDTTEPAAMVNIQKPTNVIFHGPPGTGKTWITAREAVLLCDGHAPAERSALMQRYDELVQEGRVHFVTFHQSYSYEDFVEGLRPIVDSEEPAGAGVRLAPRPGVFRRISALAEAAKYETDASVQFVLIIDEINRANISKVFGELITLLEPDKRLGQLNALRVQLPYTGDTFGVPDNLHIIGTMNTADRSIALLDTALRRRFEFREIMPQPELLHEAEAAFGIDLVAVLRTLNARVEFLFDREHQIGHAYFLACRSKADVDDIMRFKVIPLLCEYFYEDWEKVAAVLGDADGSGKFLERSALPVPPGLEETRTDPAWRWSVKSTFADNVYDSF